MRQLQPGDHIRCDRVAYHHHGIYVGDGMVIHLQGKLKSITRPENSACQKCRENGKSNGEIVKTCLECFLNGAPFEIVKYRFIKRKPSHEVIKRATDFLENGGFGSYHFLLQNCEHFATYCVTGSDFSRQTWTIVGTAIGTVVAGPIAPIIGVFSFILGKAIT
ncbi:hypothetical protein PTKIN_Ptkin01aG0343400 [Pterospermum kingtungense]